MENAFIYQCDAVGASLKNTIPFFGTGSVCLTLLIVKPKNGTVGFGQVFKFEPKIY